MTEYGRGTKARQNDVPKGSAQRRAFGGRLFAQQICTAALNTLGTHTGTCTMNAIRLLIHMVDREECRLIGGSGELHYSLYDKRRREQLFRVFCYCHIIVLVAVRKIY